MTKPMIGRLFPTATGYDLVLTRTFRAPVEDVWASVTESERTARWFGPWKGEAGVGRTVQVQMAFEETTPWMDALIEACEPPHRLGLSVVDEHGEWHLELRLTETAGVTELSLVHHLKSTQGVGEFGPGWDYYLDLLVASRDGTPQPSFDDYYPALKEPYEALA